MDDPVAAAKRRLDAHRAEARAGLELAARRFDEGERQRARERERFAGNARTPHQHLREAARRRQDPDRDRFTVDGDDGGHAEPTLGVAGPPATRRSGTRRPDDTAGFNDDDEYYGNQSWLR